MASDLGYRKIVKDILLDYAKLKPAYGDQERLAQIAAMPPRPGQEALRAKIQEWKAKLFSS